MENRVNSIRLARELRGVKDSYGEMDALLNYTKIGHFAEVSQVGLEWKGPICVSGAAASAPCAGLWDRFGMLGMEGSSVFYVR